MKTEDIELIIHFETYAVMSMYVIRSTEATNLSIIRRPSPTYPTSAALETRTKLA